MAMIGERVSVELEVKTNDDVGMESLMFDAEVSGDSANGPGTLTSAAVLSLYIEDDTTPKITPKTSEADYDAIKAVIAAAAGDDGLNPEPAESFTLMFSDLFTVMDGYTATYGVSQAGTSVSALPRTASRSRSPRRWLAGPRSPSTERRDCRCHRLRVLRPWRTTPQSSSPWMWSTRNWWSC